jgi:hypothetical protein
LPRLTGEAGEEFLYDTYKKGYGLGIKGYIKKMKKCPEAKM